MPLAAQVVTDAERPHVMLTDLLEQNASRSFSVRLAHASLASVWRQSHDSHGCLRRDKRTAGASLVLNCGYTRRFAQGYTRRVVNDTAIDIRGLEKVFAGGLHALDAVDLAIGRGEIFALLGPNGAGKTTLISVICGLLTATDGDAWLAGYHFQREFRAARARIGLVPQELTTDAFETVWATVRFSRGLFGRRRDSAYLEKVLKDLSLWDKRNDMLMTLSGGMKRRVMIAKALSHEPDILFLDEPTAGVDVELRRGMWQVIDRLRRQGVTIVLTTHYLEEAEQMADRVGVINHGRVIRVEPTESLMRSLGQKRLMLTLDQPLEAVPDALSDYGVTLSADGDALHYHYHHHDGADAVQALLRDVDAAGLRLLDVDTYESSLEEIFMDMVGGTS